MVKRCIFMTILAVASALITQEILWNSWLLSQCTHHDISQLIDVSAPIGGNNIQQHGNYDKKEQFSRLSTKPTNIYALGERNSGTNYLVKILKQAFIPPNIPDSTRTHEYFSSDIPVLLHKHMFRHHLLNETELAEINTRTDILWLFAVRSPCEWAEAMKRMPWHMCDPRNIVDCPKETFVGFERKQLMKTITLEKFFQLPWGDWPESRNFRNLSFTSPDFTYNNVFHLRRHKLMLMKQIMDTVPQNVKIVRLHELERAPHIFIQNLCQEYNLTLRDGYKDARPSQQMHLERCLSETEWRLAQQEIDWHLEGLFGYTSLDCHMCYGNK